MPSFSMGSTSKRSRLSIDEEAKSDSGEEENGLSNSPKNEHSNGTSDFGSSGTYSSAAQRMMVGG